MGGFRPLEILALSLAAPAVLFCLLWFWAVPRREGPLKPPAAKSAPSYHSRTRPIPVFEGKLTGNRKLRVYRGLTPGLEGTGAGRRALRLLGGKNPGPPLTLLIRNASKKSVPPLKGDWSLSQGKDRKWVLASPFHPGSALGRLLAGLYCRGDAAIPPGGVARFLFLPSNAAAPLPGKPLLLEGPRVKTVLSPRALPAQDVFQAWEKPQKH